MLQPTPFSIVNFIYLILINFMRNVISQITLTLFLLCALLGTQDLCQSLCQTSKCQT